MYLGSREIDDTLVFTCQTHAADTQVSTDADSAPSYRVYEDETGTAILTGSMALLDDANTVGQYSEQITLSAANGFEQGKSYTVRIQATVGGVTGATDRHFQVGAKVNVTRLAGTAQTARDIGASVLLSSGTGTGQISLSSGAVLLQSTQTGVTIPTVTTLTNAPSDSSGVTTLLSRVTAAVALASDLSTLAGKFTGITLLRHWLGALAGKQSADATALTEIRAAGAGSGTYDPTTDSLEAIKDDAATVTDVATGVRTELTTELARIDVNTSTRLAAADISLSGGAVTVGTNNDKTGYRLSATGVDDVLDEVVLGSYTMRQLLRGIAAATLGKVSGAATTSITFRSADDTKDVIVATVDADGNRSAITLDLT